MGNQNYLDQLNGLNQSNNAFPYNENIKTPEELGIGGWGVSNFDNDVNKIMSYVKLLLEGDSEASKINGNLGNNYFVETPAKCINVDNAEQVTRSLYINNSSNNSKGLITMINNSINNLDPLSTFKSLFLDANPTCKMISLKTRIDGVDNIDTKYLTMDDIKGLNPCLFENNKNSITDQTCSEVAGFTNYKYIMPNSTTSSIIKKLYFTALIILAYYILTKKRR